MEMPEKDVGEPAFRVQQKGNNEEKKSRFGGILKDSPIKGFKSETLTRPLTGLFRKTGKSPKRRNDEDSEEPTFSTPPTNVPNVTRITATLEREQINEELSQYRERNAETGSKLTLSEGAVFGSGMHPLTRYFDVGGVDLSILGRSFPTEKMVDEDGPWTAQSLFNSLESRIKKERMETKDQTVEPRMLRGIKDPFGANF